MLISNFVIKIILFRIVFVQSKMDSNNLPVLKLHFGMFEDCSLKIRGIESRFYDTPHLIYKCPNEMMV